MADNTPRRIGIGTGTGSGLGARPHAPGELGTSRLAGLFNVSPVLVGLPQDALLRQAIANGQRTRLSDSDTAGVIATLTERGMKNAEIATILALPDPQSLKHYRALAQVDGVPELARWVNKGSVRALYELHRAWLAADDMGRQLMAEALDGLDNLTVTAARRIIEAAAPAKVEAMAEKASGASTEPAAEAEPLVTPKRRAKAADADPDAEREALARAWLADPRRPRPALDV